MNARLIAERCPPMPGASRQLGSALPSLCPWHPLPLLPLQVRARCPGSGREQGAQSNWPGEQGRKICEAHSCFCPSPGLWRGGGAGIRREQCHPHQPPPPPTGSSGSLTSPMALAICPPLQEAGTLCGGHWGLRGESGGGWSLGWGTEGVLGSALGIGQWLPPKA